MLAAVGLKRKQRPAHDMHQHTTQMSTESHPLHERSNTDPEPKGHPAVCAQGKTTSLLELELINMDYYDDSSTADNEFDQILEAATGQDVDVAAPDQAMDVAPDHGVEYKTVFFRGSYPNTLVTHRFSPKSHGLRANDFFLPEKLCEAKNVVICKKEGRASMTSCTESLRSLYKYNSLLYYDPEQTGSVFVVEIQVRFMRLWHGKPSDITPGTMTWEVVRDLHANSRLCDVYVGPGMTVFGSMTQAETITIYGPESHMEAVEMERITLCEHKHRVQVRVAASTKKEIVRCKDCARQRSSKKK